MLVAATHCSMRRRRVAEIVAELVDIGVLDFRVELLREETPSRLQTSYSSIKDY